MTCKVDCTYITQLKLQKLKRRWYYTALHWHSGDVQQSNITFFFIFLAVLVDFSCVIYVQSTLNVVVNF